MRTLDTNQRTKSQTWPETCRDWLSTIANVVWTYLSYFQLSNAASSFSNKMDWKANKYEFNWATLQQQAKDTNDTNQRIWRSKVLKFVLRWRKPGSHKPTNPLDNWLSARQWAGERGDPGFPQEFLSKSNRRIWMQACATSYLSSDPLWPRVQLVSLGPNALIAEIWEPRMQQRGQSINLPEETSGQQHASLTLGQNWKRWNLWFGHASCGPTRSYLPNLANQLGAFAGREGVSTSVSRRSWCECSNIL